MNGPSAARTELFKQIYQPVSTYGEPWYAMEEIPKLFVPDENGKEKMNFDVDYQRGHVWSKTQRENFMGYFLSGAEVPRCYLNAGPEGDLDPMELIDGKQRVVAIKLWIEGKISANHRQGRFGINSLDESTRTLLLRKCGLTFARVRMTRVEVLDFYIRLNGCGVRHTPKELTRVQRLLAEAMQAG